MSQTPAPPIIPVDPSEGTVRCIAEFTRDDLENTSKNIIYIVSPSNGRYYELTSEQVAALCARLEKPSGCKTSPLQRPKFKTSRYTRKRNTGGKIGRPSQIKVCKKVFPSSDLPVVHHAVYGTITHDAANKKWHVKIGPCITGRLKKYDLHNDDEIFSFSSFDAAVEHFKTAHENLARMENENNDNVHIRTQRDVVTFEDHYVFSCRLCNQTCVSWPGLVQHLSHHKK